MAGTRKTYIKRITLGRPLTNINQAASGVVSASVRSSGQILINDSDTNLFKSGDLLGGFGLNKTYDPSANTITLALDSDQVKEIVDSNYNALVSGSPFIDSAYFDSNLQALQLSIVPYADSTYDLGSPTKKFRKLYLSGNTIVLGNLNIGDEAGTFTIRDSDGVIAALNLDGNTTSDLAEGSNLYYTRARFDSALGDNTSISSIRGYINVIDAGGDGSFTYDSALGKITYTGPSAAEVRAHFSAQGDLSYDSSTGVFSFDVEQVYTQANFESDLSQSVAGGTGITYDSATQTISITNTGVIAGEYGSQTQVPIITVNAQGQIDSIGEILVAGVTGFSLDSASGVLTITTADGGSFSAPIHSRDSALLTDISGTTLNYGTGRISQLTSDSASITTIDNNVLRTNDLDADSGVVTDISGTTLNYGTGRISQLTSDSASITTIDNNVLRTNQLDADSGVVTNISGTSLNYGTGNFTSATAAGLTVNGVSNLDSTNVDGSLYVSGNLTVQGTTTTVNSTTVTLNDKNLVLADSAASLAELDGAGITMGGAGISTPPEMKYVTTGDLINFNRAVDVDGHLNADSATFTNLSVTTVSRAATVDSGTYGSTTEIPVITVNTSGFIDSIGTVVVAGVSSTSWDSTNEQLTINTADGQSFVTTINGFNNLQADSASITNISGTSLNYGTGNFTNVTIDSAVITDISGTTLNYGTGQISQLSVDSGTFTTLAINGRTIDSDWVTSFAKNFEGDITITTTQDDAAVGPTLTLYRNSASPADSDLIGQIIFKGQDDSGNAQEFAKMRAVITDASGDSEYGSIETFVLENGGYTAVTRQTAYGFEILNNIPLSLNGDIIYNGVPLDSSWVGERARVITSPEVKFIDVSDSSTFGPKLTLDRNSASPSDSDAIGIIEFRGRNSVDSEIKYGSIEGFINDASADSEDGEIQFHLAQSGFDRTKLTINKNGIELGVQEKLIFQTDSYQQSIQPGTYTADHTLTLPDSTGTLLTVGHMFNLIDSAYVGLRQGATGQVLSFKDRDSNEFSLTVTESVSFTGGIVSLGNTVTLLDEDSAEILVAL